MAAEHSPYDAFIFDLDGTLAETRRDIAAAVNDALSSLGRPALDPGVVTRMVGDGARKLLERAVGSDAPPGQLERGLEVFLAAYLERCLETTTLYPGTRAALTGLAPARLAVLTNKPRAHTIKILEGLGILSRFESVVCGDDAWPRKPDPAGLLHLVALLGAPPARTLYVGDSAVDLETARRAGVPAGFVTYGFRPEAREGQRPEQVLGDLRELLPGGGRSGRKPGEG